MLFRSQKLYDSYDGIDEEEEAKKDVAAIEEDIAKGLSIARKLKIKRLGCISHKVLLFNEFTNQRASLHLFRLPW